LQFANLAIPTKYVTIRENDKPWFTFELRLEIRKINRLHKIAKKNKRIQDIYKFKAQRKKYEKVC